MVGKEEEFGSMIKMMISLKIVKTLFLPYHSIREIEVFIITKSVLGINLKLLHAHVGGSLRVQFPLYSYWFRPWLLS